MATINKKLVHFNLRTEFEKRKAAGDILESSICWIKDAKLIYTHGTYYDCSTLDLSSYVTTTTLISALAPYALASDLSNKQDKGLKFTNLTASSWVSGTTYEDYPYRCDVVCSGVTADDYAEVVFDLEQATSGEYAPLCETKANAVAVWSAVNNTIVIPTIIITK